MPGVIGTNKTRQRQVFRQLSPPVQSTIIPAGHERFFPRRAPARDAAPPKPHAITRDALERIVPIMADIGARIDALERQRALQKQFAAQQQQIVQQRPPTTQPNHQPMPTQDHACSCQHVPTPQRSNTHDGATPMRNPGLAPNRFITHDVSFSREVERIRTRDQNNFGEKPPSRFSSAEADRMASHIVGAGPPTAKEMNDAARAYWSRDAKQQFNTSGGHGVEAIASDPSERFVGNGPFDQFGGDASRPSPAALSELNAQYSKAKTPQARDSIEDAWKTYMRGSRDDGGARWKPKQPAISSQAPKANATEDAPWSNLYEANKGTIGGDPNKISPGMELSMPGGGSHTVQSGETLSGIASSSGGAGGGLGGRSLAAETGGVSPTGGNYSSGGQISGETGGATSVPSSLGSSAPTPPTRPAGLGGQEEASSSSSSSETPTPPTKPASLGGTGESPSGLNPEASEGGGASSTGSEGTGLAKTVRSWVTGETE